MTAVNPSPKPRDPRHPQRSAAEITQEFEAVLDTPTSSTADEAAVLARAHAVLADALQRTP